MHGYIPSEMSSFYSTTFPLSDCYHRLQPVFADYISSLLEIFRPFIGNRQENIGVSFALSVFSRQVTNCKQKLFFSFCLLTILLRNFLFCFADKFCDLCKNQ